MFGVKHEKSRMACWEGQKVVHSQKNTFRPHFLGRLIFWTNLAANQAVRARIASVKVRKSLFGGWSLPGADVDATTGMGSALEAIEVAAAAKGAKMRLVSTPPKQIWHDLL